jgi:outer membrane lipoprotein-sorting protein
MKTLARTCLPLAALALAAAPSRSAIADGAGDGVLSQIDAAMNRAKTLQFEYDIVNKPAGKDEKTLGLIVKLKGEKRFSEFVSPADMKGTKVLILSPTQMYVYLPAFGKVRRIANHTKDQGFLGLTFSQDDMATTAYGTQYTASVASEDAGAWHLVLTAKAGQDVPYPKIEMTVTKDKKVPSELKYWNADGKNIKTETRSNYTCEGDVCTPGELKMTDNVSGAWTKLQAKSRKINAEISDDVFSQRNLGE